MQMMYAFGIGLVLFLAVFLFIRKDVQRDVNETRIL